MAIVKWVLIAALAAAPAAAQPNVARVIPVRHADVKALANTLGVFGCGMAPNAELKVLAVSCPPGVLSAFEEAVKRLDVPPPAAKNIEITAYFLLGAEKEMHEGAPVPPELEPVVKQIRSVFAFKNFGLLDTLVLRTRAGQPANAQGVIQINMPPGAATGASVLAIKSATLGGDGAPLVRIDGLKAIVNLPVRTPASVTAREAAVNADIDIREGQKVVVGKSSIEGPGKALIVVLSARVM